MSHSTYRSISTRQTPQTEKILGRETDQAPNNAGGFSFVLDDWKRLKRFLILGTDGGTYYVSEQKLTKENAGVVMRCLLQDGERTVNTVIEISNTGRAPKNDPALFALAICASLGSEVVKQKALKALPSVARIGTHLFHFSAYVQNFRGWGRSLRTGIGNWYLNRTPENLALQMVKYQQRDGWSHRDLLRLSHPIAGTPAQQAMFRWAVGKEAKQLDLPDLIIAFERAKTANVAELIELIQRYHLPREAIPTPMLLHESVWEALITHMPLEALVRNLATMTRVGLLRPYSDAVKEVAKRLGDQENIRVSRLHPIKLLAALITYQQGRGERGNNVWNPIPQIVDALDAAFYLAFQNVTPSNKNTLLGLDISSSMSAGNVSGIPGLTPAMASAAMALVTAKTEPNWLIIGFSTKVIPLPITPNMSLGDAVTVTRRLTFGGTDCAKMFQWALAEALPVEAFVTYTDNETYAGNSHPSQALQAFREGTGIPSKSVVVGTASTGFTIADPNDGGMLDVVGFDSGAPQVISDFFAA